MIESSSSWIDLPFTTPPNLVVESGVHISLYFCIQIAIIIFYLQNLIYKYITQPHTHERSGTISKQMLNLPDSCFQYYPLSTFILLVFRFLRLKYNGHKTSMQLFVLFLSCLFVFLAKHLILAEKTFIIIK